MTVDVHPAQMDHFRMGLLRWGASNFADFPWRFIDNSWLALVAEIMLQRTRAEQVVPVFEAFAAQYDTPQKFAANPPQNAFAGLGLHWRHPLLLELAGVLSEQPIPDKQEALTALPGVGDYVAAAYLSMHRNLRATIIDSNVVRLYARVFGFDYNGETRRKRWFRDLADRLTPIDTYQAYNYALLDFTRSICRPKPHCVGCAFRPYCDFGTHLLRALNESG